MLHPKVLPRYADDEADDQRLFFRDYSFPFFSRSLFWTCSGRRVFDGVCRTPCLVLQIRILCLGFRLSDSVSRIPSFGFCVSDSVSRILSFGFRLSDSVCRILSFGCRGAHLTRNEPGSGFSRQPQSSETTAANLWIPLIAFPSPSRPHAGGRSGQSASARVQ